jgi:hypothetical protein
MLQCARTSLLFSKVEGKKIKKNEKLFVLFFLWYLCELEACHCRRRTLAGKMSFSQVLQFPDRRLFDKHQDRCNGSLETAKAVNATEVHFASFVNSSGYELKRREN